MRNFYKLFCFIILSTGSAGSGFGATNFVTCNFLTISNALVRAAEGDTVLVLPGSCVWEHTINLNSGKSFTFKGSGTNATTLISADLPYCLGITSNSTNVFTISDFNCVGSIANAYGFFIFGGNPPSTPMKGLCHVYNLQMTNCLARGINMGYGDSFGLIDHCYFICPSNSSPQPISFGGNEYRSWTNANPLGTTKVVCVEDCYFRNDSGIGNGFFDGYNGAQIVWRHNYMSGAAPSGVHGYDSQATSARTWEIYNNVFTNGSTKVLAIELRGGTGVVYSNSVYGYVDFCELAYYRSCVAPQPYTSPATDAYGMCLGPVPDITFASNPTDNQIYRLALKTYTFKRAYANTQGLVVIGANTAHTLTNLFAAINLVAVNGTGAGTRYAANMIKNDSFRAIAVTPTTISITNMLDGNIDGTGYPGNQQPGVINAYPFTNNQVLLPCYSWGNTMDGSNQGFTLKGDTDQCNHNITNLVKLNRDYFNDTPMPGYTPLVYPHPLNTVVLTGLSSTKPTSSPSLRIVPNP